MSDISASAASAREAARQTNGKFGQQEHPESGDMDLGSGSATEAPDVIGFTGANGVPFRVRYVDTGEAYGHDGVLTAGEPLVEFYDAKYAGDDRFGENGQFVTRYAAETLLGTDGFGQTGGHRNRLNLDGGVPEWTVDADSMNDVIDWLEKRSGASAHDDDVERHAWQAEAEDAARDDSATREVARQALEGYRLNLPLQTDADVRLSVAAQDLERILPGVRREPLEAARVQFEEELDEYAHSHRDSFRVDISRRAFHAELADALDDAPSRGELAAYEEDAAEALERLNAAHIDQALGEADPRAVQDAEVAVRNAQRRVADARRERQAATLKRVLADRPTLHDMRELSDQQEQAMYARRKAVNAADAARDAYVGIDETHPEFEKRRLAVDEATRREGEASSRYMDARRNMDLAHTAWRKITQR